MSFASFAVSTYRPTTSFVASPFVEAKPFVRDSGLVPNLSTDVVQMAFPLHDVAPVSGDWKSATWATDPTTNPIVYKSRCLVGPAGTITLAAGLYDVWVKITHGSEVAVLKCEDESLEVF